MLMDYLFESLKSEKKKEIIIGEDLFSLTKIDRLVSNLAKSLDVSIDSLKGKKVKDVLQMAKNKGMFVVMSNWPKQILDTVI